MVPNRRGTPTHGRPDSSASQMLLTVGGNARHIDTIRRASMTSPSTSPPQTESDLDHLDDDDRPIGRILSRREVLALIGAGGTAAFLAACTPAGGTSTASAGASAGERAEALGARHAHPSRRVS